MTKMINIYKEYTDLSDLYKEAHGFRPRHYKEWWTEEELQAEYKYLYEICEENYRVEKIQEEKALVEFEKLLEETIALGAADRETAMRWLVDAEDLTYHRQDLEYFFWGYGLSYEKQREYASLLSN